MNPIPREFSRLLSAARNGSRDALGEAFEACRRYLHCVARHELAGDLQSKGGASDLVQETFLEAQSTFDHFQGTSEIQLRAWLRRLLHHRAAKFGRSYRTTQKRRLGRENVLSTVNLTVSSNGGLRTEQASPSAHLMAFEQAQRLRQALEKLPHEYQRVITYRYVEECSFDEIGRLMNRTANAARLLWLRAIECIKHELRSADES
jgi:RNA polymerase sigma-70 factor (ECF subfamily)